MAFKSKYTGRFIEHLLELVNALQKTPDDYSSLIGYRVIGKAEPGTTPLTPNTPIAYYATEGTYTHFKGQDGNPLVVYRDELCHLTWEGEYWKKTLLTKTSSTEAYVYSLKYSSRSEGDKTYINSVVSKAQNTDVTILDTLSKIQREGLHMMYGANQELIGNYELQELEVLEYYNTLEFYLLNDQNKLVNELHLYLVRDKETQKYLYAIPNYVFLNNQNTGDFTVKSNTDWSIQ